MKRRTLGAKLAVLSRAVEDHTGPGEVVRIVERIHPDRAEESLRSRVAAIIEELHDAGDVTLGQPLRDGRFERWEVSSGRASKRISREWDESCLPHAGKAWRSGSDRDRAHAG